MSRYARPDAPIGEAPMRPVGVTIIALLTGISGLLSLVSGLLTPSLWLAAEGGGGSGFPPVTTLVPFLLLGAAVIFLAWGRWSLKPWAWTIQIILLVLGVVIDISTFPGDWFNPFTWGILLLEILILYYLLRPRVRVAFGRAQPHTQ